MKKQFVYRHQLDKFLFNIRPVSYDENLFLIYKQFSYRNFVLKTISLAKFNHWLTFLFALKHVVNTELCTSVRIHVNQSMRIHKPRRVNPIVGSYWIPTENDRIPLYFYRTDKILWYPGNGPTTGSLVLESYRIQRRKITESKRSV